MVLDIKWDIAVYRIKMAGHTNKGLLTMKITIERIYVEVFDVDTE